MGGCFRLWRLGGRPRCILDQIRHGGWFGRVEGRVGDILWEGVGVVIDETIV